MATTIVDFFRTINEAKDPRLQHHILVKYTSAPFIIFTVFLIFVWGIGPKLMKNREPFQLRKIIMFYNCLQIFINSWFFINAFSVSKNIGFTCEPIDNSIGSDAKIVRYFYYYYLIKIFDLLDTIFFILRKKHQQLSFLHVYHHAGMILTSYVGCAWFLGGIGIHIGTVNSFVHAVMYFYYFLTSYDSTFKENAWWKKYITQLQMVQHFTITFIFASALLNPDCEYPKMASYLLLPNGIILITLFSNFYIKTYVMKKKKVEDKQS